MPFLGGEDMFTAKFLDEAGEAGLGTLLFATFSPHDARPDVVDFIARHRRRTGGPPDRFAALAYDAFSQLAEAIRRAGSTRSAAVREAMTSRKDAEGVTGRTNWADRGTPLKNSFIHRVEAGEAGPEFVLLKWLRNKPE
jgi:branched-chain amino acid transport system substrate-binding protein